MFIISHAHLKKKKWKLMGSEAKPWLEKNPTLFDSTLFPYFGQNDITVPFIQCLVKCGSSLGQFALCNRTLSG